MKCIPTNKINYSHTIVLKYITVVRGRPILFFFYIPELIIPTHMSCIQKFCGFRHLLRSNRFITINLKFLICKSKINFYVESKCNRWGTPITL